MTDIDRLNEYTLSEKPALELLSAMGYQYVPGANLMVDRHSIRDAILAPRLERAIRHLNPWIDDNNVGQAVKRMLSVRASSLIEANASIYTDLVHSFSLQQDLGRGLTHQTVRLIDWDHPTNNEFLVSNQFEVLGHKDKIIPDVVVFVNGLPLAVIECKSPKLPNPLELAIGQLIRYQSQAPRLFECAQILVGTCGPSAAYAPLGADARFFLRWRDTWPLTSEQIAQIVGHRPTAQDILLAVMFEPARFLDLMRNFVAFETEHGRVIKKLARYQQYRAVNKTMERILRAQSREERGGVIWHTQGSGKSLTMLWLALKLRRPEEGKVTQMGELSNPTVVIVTDRIDLDNQIAATFQRAGFPNPVQANSVAELRELLRQGVHKTILTTVQKFQTHQGETYPQLTEASNIVVLVDEAHRTQYKGLAVNMRTALPNAIYIGFSGTPIDKNDRSTPRTFGTYIDTYTIQESIDDGATVEIRYHPRLPSLHVEGSTLDQLFDRVFRDLTEDERAELKRRYATPQAIAAAPERIKAICLDLLDHFENAIAVNGFKAQVVAADRRSAMRYYKTLRSLNCPECALIMSSSTSDTDPEWISYAADKVAQESVKQRFLKPDDPLKIIVVCDMWLTGFDAPIEQVMYLDSPLREHNLLQAIARVNRPSPSKDFGLVVDYWGISADLHLALHMFNDEDVEGVMLPLEEEKARLAEHHSAAMRFFSGVDRNDIYACVDIIQPEDVRARFEAAFRTFARSLNMVMPDPAANPYRRDFSWMGMVRMFLHHRLRDEQFELSPFGVKVQALIDEHIRATGMEYLTQEPLSILEPGFAAYVEGIPNKRAQAQEIEHAVRHEIRIRFDENPVVYESLRERLERLIEAHRQQVIDDLELLEQLLAIRQEMETQHQADEKMGLQVYERPFYDTLIQACPDELDSLQMAALARQMVSQLRDQTVVDWTAREDIRREMRRQVKQTMRAAGLSYEQAEVLAPALVSLAAVWLA